MAKKKNKSKEGQGKLNKYIESFNNAQSPQEKQKWLDKANKVADKNDLAIPDAMASWKNPESTITPSSFEGNLADTDKLVETGLRKGEELADKYIEDFVPISEQVDPLVAQQLALLQSQQGGYTAAENQALIEGAQRGIDQNYQTQMRQLAGQNAVYGRTGGAALTPLQQLAAGRVLGQQQLQSDILTKNIEEQRQRQQYYTGALERKQAFETASATYNRAAKDAKEAQRLGTIYGGAALHSGTYGGIAGQNLEETTLAWIQKQQEEENKLKQGYIDSFMDFNKQALARTGDIANQVQLG